MQRLIDANKLLTKAFGKRGGLIHTSEINKMPTVELRAKGHWIPQKGGGVCCSECAEYALDRADGRYVLVSVKSNFCPNCGADMRGGNHENDNTDKCV